jgi:ATP-dependent RNA helicase SUPV3L1/SUV3
MGLNLDVDHVAFASDRKFDGYQFRRLSPAEFAQVAGRAGRATRNGTFGTTGRCPPFEDDLAQALENHTFEPLRVLQWRNTDLDFSSLGALQASLATTPTEAGLTRAPVAEDILVLEHAARDEEIRALAVKRDAIERLWDVCQVPDYRKIAPATHAELVVTLYGFLMREGKIPGDWFATHVAQADRTDGDIDTLSNRIAHVRTWTFVANRPDWLADPEHWQGVARTVEDKLSDALHERLTERFVDRRTSVLMRRLRENTTLETEIQKTGEVVVEGHTIGRLDGFSFAPDAAAGGSDAKALQAAARSVLAGEIDARAAKVAHAPEREFVLSSDGVLRWTGAPVGRLIPGDDVLRPRLRVIADEQLGGASREAVQGRLELWLKTHIERLLAPLFALTMADDITGITRGIAFQLMESLGVLERQKVAEEVKGLDQPSRATLRKYGVRFGAYHIYLPGLLKPAPRSLAAQLWALKHESPEVKGLDELQRLAGSGRTSIPVDAETPKELYRTVGYRICGERAIRVDILERLADLIRPALAWREGANGTKPPGAFDGRGFVVTGAMTSLTGASGEDFASILRSLGYRMEKRPKPPEPAAAEPTTTAPAATEIPASEATAETPSVSEATAETAAVDAAADAETTEATMDAPAVDAAPAEADANMPVVTQFEVPAAELPIAEAPMVESPPAAPSEPLVAAGVAPQGGPPEVVAAEVAAPAEPPMIEVWRVGRPPGTNQRRREHERRGRRRDHTAKPEAVSAEPGAAATSDATAPAGEAPSATPRSDNDGRPRHRRREHGERRFGERKPGQEGAPAEQQTERRDRAERRDKTERAARPERSEQPGRRDRGPRRDRDHRDDNRPSRTWSSAQEHRGSEPDPNSPFAKLLALKQQLESDKDGR